ncbi:MAG: hypothetical protein NTY02_12315 [Acidobacteria bacterium]|nr:hypothetical protein [Acidobacteriota bacterium]
MTRGQLCVALCLVAVAACESKQISKPQPPVVVASEVKVESLTIAANTQGEVEKLRIGIANVWERDMTDAAGAPKKVLSAQAWISYQDDEKKDVSDVVFPGKQIAVGEYSIRITNVRAEGDTGQVSLEIWRK